ncbi:MAG: glycosyltransferase family 4 protein [Acidobacteriota bacterium]|nr:glycosyltransferase family 4 protein [Acidobacteriota bacterium]
MENARRPKILMITPELDFGGVETAVRDRAVGLREVGYEVEIACFWKLGQIGKKLQQGNFKVFDLNLSPRIPNFKLVLKLIKFFRAQKPDVIHAACIEANFHCLLASRLSGVGRVLVEEVGNLTNGIDEPSRSWKARKVAHLIWKNADNILAISQAVKRDIVNWENAKESKITVIPYYIDFTRFNFAAAPEKKKSKEEFIIGYVGRLSPEKGQKVLLEALKFVLPEKGNVKVWLIGDGTDKENLKNLVEELGIAEKVKFWGMRDDIPELLAEMNLLVQSSYYEGLGIAIQEAMASGVPVIASEVGGVPELIEQRKTGVMFPVGNSRILADEIIRMINLDETERRRMIQEAREFVESRFSKAIVIKQLSDLYFETFEKQKR